MKITHNGRPYIFIGCDWHDEQNLKVSQQLAAELNRYLCNDQEV